MRPQTYFIILAVLLGTACLCLPVGNFFGQTDSEHVATLYNLWAHVEPSLGIGQPGAAAAVAREGGRQFTPRALFALLLLTTSGLGMSLSARKNRLAQSRLVLLCAILYIGWYIIYGAMIYMLTQRYAATFSPTPWAAFPALSAILCYLAFRGIIKDEMLIRSYDRLRP